MCVLSSNAQCKCIVSCCFFSLWWMSSPIRKTVVYCYLFILMVHFHITFIYSVHRIWSLIDIFYSYVVTSAWYINITQTPSHVSNFWLFWPSTFVIYLNLCKLNYACTLSVDSISYLLFKSNSKVWLNKSERDTGSWWRLW